MNRLSQPLSRSGLFSLPIWGILARSVTISDCSTLCGFHLLVATMLLIGLARFFLSCFEKPINPVIANDQIFVGHSEGLTVFSLDGNILWEKKTGDIVGKPVVVDEKVVFGNNVGDFYILNADDGEEFWYYSFPNEIYLSSTYKEITPKL